MQTKGLEKYGIRHQREVCYFDRKSYDILNGLIIHNRVDWMNFHADFKLICLVAMASTLINMD